MTREEILAMKPGRELDFLYARYVEGWTPVQDDIRGRCYPECSWLDPEGKKWSHLAVPWFSTHKVHIVRILHADKPFRFDNWFGIGLFIAPLNNDQWVCGRANKIYNLKITEDHYQDKELVICDAPMEAACKMRLILALCPGEAVNRDR